MTDLEKYTEHLETLSTMIDDLEALNDADIGEWRESGYKDGSIAFSMSMSGCIKMFREAIYWADRRIERERDERFDP